KPEKELTTPDALVTVTPSPDRRLLLTASKDGTAQLWDFASGKPVGTPLKHRGAITAALFTPDSKYVVTAGEDDAVRTWDAGTGKPAAEALPPSGAVTALAIGKTPNKDGRAVVASASGKSAHVWELLTHKEIHSHFDHEGPVSCIALSPDSQLLLVGTGGD